MDNPQLWCLIQSLNGDEDGGTKRSRSFRQEAGKKSSFLLENNEGEGGSLVILRSSELEIACCRDSSGSPTEGQRLLYFLGGFQVISNAKNVEVYLTDKDGKEAYLMTSKGIPFEKGKHTQEWYKAVCVIPGGPRPTLCLKIKLASIKPMGETTAKIHYLKLTARRPDPTADPTSSDVFKPAPPPSPQEFFSNMGQLPNINLGRTGLQPTTATPTLPSGDGASITQGDLGAAMASLSFVARNTERAIEDVVKERFSKLEQSLNMRLERYEQHIGSLTNIIVSQKTALDEQYQLAEQQRTMMQLQSEQMSLLLKKQESLTHSILELQNEMLSLRGTMQPLPEKMQTKSRINRKIANNAIFAQDDEPMERGIEQTLSNLENTEEDDEDVRNPPILEEKGAVKTPSSLVKKQESHGADPFAEVEKIEVSLLEGESEQLKEHVHEEKSDDQIVVPTQSNSNDERNLEPKSKLNKKERSFEDRNDKNEAKEPDAPDKMDIELMAGGPDQIVEVIEENPSNEHERSPPEVDEDNLLDL